MTYRQRGRLLMLVIVAVTLLYVRLVAFGGPPVGVQPEPLRDEVALQVLLDDPAVRHVVVPAQEDPYELGAEAIRLPSNTTITFESGTTFRGSGPYGLLLAHRSTNLKIIAHGATFIYGGPPDSEHIGQRACLWLMGVSNVTVEGGTFINESRGDGIKVGMEIDFAHPQWGATSPRAPSQMVTVRDVIAKGARNGVSVVSCAGFYAFDSGFENTGTLSPRAGIDWEPSAPSDVVTGLMRSCTLGGNTAFMVNVTPLGPTSTPVGITAEGITFINVPNQGGVRVIGLGFNDDAPGSLTLNGLRWSGP